MREVYRFRDSRGAQAAVFFVLAFGLICLLCGFAIDSGLLYLAKARLSRAVDGAALAAVGNFQQSDDPALNRDAVAILMRNFAIANYGDLSTVGSTIAPSGGSASNYTTTSGLTEVQYTYTFYDPAAPAKDTNGAYRRYVQIVLQTGAGGQVTSGQCNARCPVKTYFFSYLGGIVGYSSQVSGFQDLKVSSSAVATRNPRLIMVVVDRSASMLTSGGGAFGLPAAITTFLNFFDTSSDYIGIVSFSSAARLEMPLTTNFLNAGTNDLFDTYQIDNNNSAVPGLDPEQEADPATYAATGPRRLKFGGQTAADEGIRMALEQLMQNSGFSNPNVVKYMVLFTDGAWNTTRTLLAAPGYTNIVQYPVAAQVGNHMEFVLSDQYTNYASQYNITNIYIPVPTLSPYLAYESAVSSTPVPYSTPFDYLDHTNDVWQSQDGINEPLSANKTQLTGTPLTVNNSTNFLVSLPASQDPFNSSEPLDIYSPYLNVWLPPGSVDYIMNNGVVQSPSPFVSDYTKPTLTTNVTLTSGESNVLVVPGYMTDGIIFDALDLPYPDDSTISSSDYPRYREDNFDQPFMWPDDNPTNTASVSAINNYVYGAVPAQSAERALMFRNYANLLTGFYIFRPDDPIGTATNSFTQTLMPSTGNGPYYPSAAFYGPFDLVGVDYGVNFSLIQPYSDPDSTDTGNARHIAYSINMLSPAAAPEYAGELFYQSTSGVNVFSGNSAVSTQIQTSSAWTKNAPSFTTPFVAANVMTNEPSHFPTTIDGALWRPRSFNGSNDYVGTSLSAVSPSDSLNHTGGYVTDGAGNIYRNTMAYSGRPTHYYDFSTSTWLSIPDNHVPGTFVLPLGSWKAREYAWHARALGVTIFTVGYGTQVTPAEQVLLAQVANATNSTANPATNLPYNPNQPIGQQFYAATTNDISNDFYQVGTAINGALTQ